MSLYYRRMPELRGRAEQFMATVPTETSREQAVSWVRSGRDVVTKIKRRSGKRGGSDATRASHSDLRHFDMMTFTVGDVADLTGRPPEIVERMLDALSLSPGASVGHEVERLFLAHPVRARPGIKLEDSYLFAIPQASFSHINEIMRSLV